MLYWIIKNLFLAPYLRATFRPWVSGIENVPVTGAVILASNHVSVVDSLFLPLSLLLRYLERRLQHGQFGN